MTFKAIAIVGAGAMGRGIAQVCAAAGAQIWLYDSKPGAAADALASLGLQWNKLVEKGKLSSEQGQAYLAQIQVADSLGDLATCDLIVEAIVEQLDIKQKLFAELENVVSANCVLASNTSSLSVTAIAAKLRSPERFAGYHFFNPVPLMRVVEVVAGLRTSQATCERLKAWAQQMGHLPVLAQDTPGFIVNHAGRGYGTEALRIVSERVSDFVTIDRILRDQVGFKLGPFELMDLTALDVSHPVMESIYRQYFDEPRYRPSVITAQRLAGGVLGKKVGAGFYSYDQGVAQVAAEPAVPHVPTSRPVWVSHHAARKPALLLLLKNLGADIETGQTPSAEALILVAPLGLDVTTVCLLERLDPSRTIGIDLLFDDATTRRRVLATNPASRQDFRESAHALLARDGKAVSVVRDSAGFVTQRVVATIVNIASDMCQQGVCTPDDLDMAVTLGLGYPKGPLALGDALGAASILEVLVNMHTVYNDPRYRASPWLRRRAALGLSLKHLER